MTFRWRADDGPLIEVFGSSLPSSTKKTCQSWTSSEKLSGSVHAMFASGPVFGQQSLMLIGLERAMYCVVLNCAQFFVLLG